MKKLFKSLVVLFFIYYVIELSFAFFEKKHEVKYSLTDNGNKIEINETLNNISLIKEDMYSFDINVNNETKFEFQVYQNFGKLNNVIKKVRYFKDNEYACIYVKYNNDLVLHDVLCKKNNIIQYYNTIQNPSIELNNFINSLRTDEYILSDWNDEAEIKNTTAGSYYKKNLLENHYVGLTNNYGFYKINDVDNIKVVDISRSSVDFSQKKLVGFINDRYISLDYSSIVNDENNVIIYIRNVVDGSKDSIMFRKKLSINSYILGNKNDLIYIFDPDTNKEYELNLDSRKIIEVGNEETGIVYYFNGEKYRKPVSKMSEIVFVNDFERKFAYEQYQMVDIDPNGYGYNYYYLKSGAGYNVYRSTQDNKDNLTYLFYTTSLDKINYVKEYIYYVDGNRIRYYSDKTGNKTIFANNDFVSNIYSKMTVYING